MKPLTDLTCKGVAFNWEEHYTQALDQLIQMVTIALVLGCPNLDRQYSLEVNASAFTLGVVLFQYDEQNRRRDMAYFSKALTPPKYNYDI